MGRSADAHLEAQIQASEAAMLASHQIPRDTGEVYDPADHQHRREDPVQFSGMVAGACILLAIVFVVVAFVRWAVMS